MELYALTDVVEVNYSHIGRVKFSQACHVPIRFLASQLLLQWAVKAVITKMDNFRKIYARKFCFQSPSYTVTSIVLLQAR